MELAVATKKARADTRVWTGTDTRVWTSTGRRARTRRALTLALWQLLLPIALAYGVAYIVPACFSLASRQANEEPRSSGLVHGSGMELHAELVCESAAPRVWERSACNLPK
jgi:hypothetical protein